jgi:hypothetical protein
MKKIVFASSLITAWLAFVYAAPRLLSEGWVSGLTVLGMIITVGVLALTGHVSRPDPLSLNLTARRPWREMR